MAPMGPLRERKLLLEDRPLRIQAGRRKARVRRKEKAGCTAYKFVFREIVRATGSDAVHESLSAKASI